MSKGPLLHLSFMVLEDVCSFGQRVVEDMLHGRQEKINYDYHWGLQSHSISPAIDNQSTKNKSLKTAQHWANSSLPGRMGKGKCNGKQTKQNNSNKNIQPKQTQ